MQGGLSRVWQQAEEGGRIQLGSWSPDPTIRHSVWSLVIGGTLTWWANIGVNQANVQRFSAVPSLSAAKMSVLMSLPGFVILGVLASLVGLIVYSYFSGIGCDPLYSHRINNPNQLVPLFVMEVFHFLPGFAGLFGASLVCASLSTISSSINSLSAMLWEDVLKWKFPDISPERETLIVKCCVLVFGCVALGVAFLSLQLGGPATQIALSFFGASGGPLLGLFLLGALCPRANWIGALVGSVTSLGFCLWMAVGKYASGQASSSLLPAPSDQCPLSNGHLNGYHNTTELVVSDGIERESHVLDGLYSVSYLWYSGIGVLLTMVIGMAISFCTGLTEPDKVDSAFLIPWPSVCCKPAHPRDSYSYTGQPVVTQEDDTEQAYENIAVSESKPSIVSKESTV